MKLVLQLFKQVAPETDRPWMITETTITSDGFRSRICNGRWKDEGEARAEIARKEAAANAAPVDPKTCAHEWVSTYMGSSCKKCGFFTDV